MRPPFPPGSLRTVCTAGTHTLSPLVSLTLFSDFTHAKDGRQAMLADLFRKVVSLSRLLPSDSARVRGASTQTQHRNTTCSSRTCRSCDSLLDQVHTLF